MKYSKRLAVLLEFVLPSNPVAIAWLLGNIGNNKNSEKKSIADNSNDSGSTDTNGFIEGEKKANGKWSALWKEVDGKNEKILQILIIYFVLRYSIINSENNFKKVINDPTLSKKVIKEGLAIKTPASLIEKFSMIKVQLEGISYEDFKAFYGGEGTELEADGSYNEWWDNTFEPIIQEIINPKKN